MVADAVADVAEVLAQEPVLVLVLQVVDRVVAVAALVAVAAEAVAQAVAVVAQVAAAAVQAAQAVVRVVVAPAEAGQPQGTKNDFVKFLILNNLLKPHIWGFSNKIRILQPL